MNLKLIHYSISLSIQKIDCQSSDIFTLRWKIDNSTLNIPLNASAFNQPFCTQSNLIMDHEKLLEDKITTLTFLSNEKISREHKVNLSTYLNSKLKEVYDILNINEDTQLHIQWKFQKLYGIDLGNTSEKQIEQSPPKNRKSEVVIKKSVTINLQNESKQKQSEVIEKKNEESSFSMIKLVAENKKLKAQVIELKRQIESLQQAKPIYIQAEVEGYLREYQSENEKLRKLLKLNYEKNLLLQNELRKVHSQYQQNTQRFQAYISSLQNRFEEVLIGCDNYAITLDNFEQQAMESNQKLSEIEEQELQRKLELSKLLKGKLIHSTSDLQGNFSNTNSNHTSQLDYKGSEFLISQTREICQLLDKDQD